MSAADKSLAALKSRLASSSSGYGAVIDGILDVRTVCQSANLSALNALHALGYSVLFRDDEEGELYLEVLSRVAPRVKIIPVRVTEVEND